MKMSLYQNHVVISDLNLQEQYWEKTLNENVEKLVLRWKYCIVMCYIRRVSQTRIHQRQVALNFAFQS